MATGHHEGDEKAKPITFLSSLIKEDGTGGALLGENTETYLGCLSKPFILLIFLILHYRFGNSSGISLEFGH